LIFSKNFRWGINAIDPEPRDIDFAALRDVPAKKCT